MSVGLLDTSVVIDWDDPAVATALPEQVAICAITLAELTAGPHLASTGAERARGQARLQQVEATFDAIAFDAPATRNYGQVAAVVAAIGRSHGPRIAGLLVAATAHANGLTLYTRNPDDFDGLGRLIGIIAVSFARTLLDEARTAMARRLRDVPSRSSTSELTTIPAADIAEEAAAE